MLLLAKEPGLLRVGSVSICTRSEGAKLETAKYKLRKQAIEPDLGIVSAIGFVRFQLRGLDCVKSEWILVALASNHRYITNLRTA